MTTLKDETVVVIDHVIGDRGRLAVSLASAEIRLAATDGDRVIVRTPAGRNLPERVVVEPTENGLTIRESEPGLGFGRGRRVVQLEIQAPAQADVTIGTASGWLDAIGLHGDQRYRTVSGDTRLRDVAGAIELSTVSGDAQIDLSGPTDLSLKSVSGDATIRGGRLDALRVGTTSGDVRVDSPLAAATDNTIETLSGDVQLVAMSGMRVEARTVSGDLSTDLPHRSEGRMGRRTLIVGDGSVELAFRSVSGDLRILDGTRSAPTPPAAPAPPEPPFSSDIELADVDPATSSSPDREPAAVPPAASDPFETDRMTILRALERGELDVATAMDRLSALDEAPKPDPEHRR
ncbi:MAG TPA: DUF4097 family beta strand repeat-containing protein [Candidatus Limnocylindrales bacterium]|jgi:hypothetical protein